MKTKFLAVLKFNFTFNNHDGLFTPCMMGNFLSSADFLKNLSGNS